MRGMRREAAADPQAGVVPRLPWRNRAQGRVRGGGGLGRGGESLGCFRSLRRLGGGLRWKRRTRWDWVETRGRRAHERSGHGWRGGRNGWRRAERWNWRSDHHRRARQRGNRGRSGQGRRGRIGLGVDWRWWQQQQSACCQDYGGEKLCWSFGSHWDTPLFHFHRRV